jgi:hypothetical protein
MALKISQLKSASEPGFAPLLLFLWEGGNQAEIIAATTRFSRRRE